MSLEDLQGLATAKRNERDLITKELREIVAEIDKREAANTVANIVSGLSDEQKKAMYAQLVGVSNAQSIGETKLAKGNK